MSETILIDGEIRHTNHQGGEHKPHSMMADAEVGNRITSGRSQDGFARTGADLNEDSIVTIRGSEGRIGDMIRTGLVVRNEDGSYSAASEETQQQDAAESPEAQLEGLDNDTEAAITEVAEKAMPSSVMGMITSMANTGEISDVSLGPVASEMGIEPEVARDRAETIRAAFEGQARAKVDKVGLSSTDVFEWAWAEQPALMKQAIITQATQRSTKGYDKVISAYMMNLDQSNPEAILSAEFPAGVSAEKLRNGKVIIRSPHGDTDWKSAVRRGLVTMGRAA